MYVLVWKQAKLLVIHGCLLEEVGMQQMTRLFLGTGTGTSRIMVLLPSLDASDILTSRPFIATPSRNHEGEKDIKVIVRLNTFIMSISAKKISLAINRLMWKTWPDEAVQKQRIRSALEESITNPSAKCFKVVGPKIEDILGVLVLTRRQPSDAEQAKDSEDPSQEHVKSVAPAELNSDVLEVVVTALDSISEAVAGIDHIEITALVVAPSLRGKGLGGQLMEVAYEIARADRVSLVVCSEPESNEFFEKHGFQKVKDNDVDLSIFAPPFSGFGVFRLTKMIWAV